MRNGGEGLACLRELFVLVYFGVLQPFTSPYVCFWVSSVEVIE